jgi:FKBP-type peptidyl-prolyl cis-trans isomerase
MIPGWDKALRSMSVGERAVIRIVDPELAYGSSGIPFLVPPNSPVEMDVELLDVQPSTWKIDFDSLAVADNTPVSLIVVFTFKGRGEKTVWECWGDNLFLKTKRFFVL